MSAENALRILVRSTLATEGMSQAEAARRLNLSTKHMCQMLTGNGATLTIDWAEKILGLCGRRLVLSLDAPELATPAELASRQRFAWSAAGRCPMCGEADCNGRLCDDCTATVRGMKPVQRRPWRRFEQVHSGVPIQGHGYTPAGLLGIDA